jgi:hypothetical protein
MKTLERIDSQSRLSFFPCHSGFSCSSSESEHLCTVAIVGCRNGAPFAFYDLDGGSMTEKLFADLEEVNRIDAVRFDLPPKRRDIAVGELAQLATADDAHHWVWAEVWSSEHLSAITGS